MKTRTLTTKTLLALTAAALLAGTASVSTCAAATKYIESPPLSKVIKQGIVPVREGGAMQLPIITWGGDIATILANGSAKTTAPGSIFDAQGLKFSLKREDDFTGQIGDYMRGESAYLRCTLGMLNQAIEALQDPRVKPVVIGQLTYSTGGDVLVVKSSIKTPADLKGKTIVLQAYGPHVDYLTRVLSDAGIALTDVKIKWVKDLTGSDDSPAAAIRSDPSVDAAFMISPDAAEITSNGSVGTGAEKSVKGAHILMSTKTASRIIVDVYAVRGDYFQAHKDEVVKFAHALLVAQEKLAVLMRDSATQKAEFNKLMTASASILFDSPQAVADVKGLYGDCEYVGFVGNVNTFTSQTFPRRFSILQDEIQTGLMGLGLLGSKVAVETAGLDYDALKQGLTQTVASETPKFQSTEVAKVMAQRSEQGTLKDNQLFEFEVFFKPNQATFAPEAYAGQFDEVIKRAAIYAGAIITVEGYADPTGYCDAKNKGQPPLVLSRIRQSANNTSLNRAVQVREAIVNYAKSKGVALDPSQFTTMGHGISDPKTGATSDGEPIRPTSKEAAFSNMRCELRIVNVEAESVWTPDGGGK
jgi:outer membrane protein OmpA-like peptidoglycan-associated protein